MRISLLFGWILALALFQCSCATSFVRSDSTATPDHVYPATTFDAEFLWHSGIKGEPMFPYEDPDYRESAGTRVMSATGALIDMPFSLVTDTLFLPLDLIRMHKERQKHKEQPEDTYNE